jgi:hypothetical protein
MCFLVCFTFACVQTVAEQPSGAQVVVELEANEATSSPPPKEAEVVASSPAPAAAQVSGQAFAVS